MGIDKRKDMGVDICVDMSVDTCIDMRIGMCVGMRTDVSTRMRMMHVLCRRVLRPDVAGTRTYTDTKIFVHEYFNRTTFVRKFRGFGYTGHNHTVSNGRRSASRAASADFDDVLSL